MKAEWNMSIDDCGQLNKLADLTIRSGWGTPPKLLDLLQHWACRDRPGVGRGTVFMARAKWLELLGVSLRTLQRSILRLVGSGWIRAAWVRDGWGREVPGFEVALESRAGFVVEPSLDCRDNDANLSRPSTIENEGEGNSSIGVAVRSDSVDQIPLFQIEEVPCVPKPDQHDQKQREEGRDRKQAAEGIAQYERDRYSQHPRCQRPKRTDPKSIGLVVKAIVHVLDSGVSEVDCRAAIELQWARAIDDEKSWEYWTGIELWRGAKLSRLLAWLEEPRNDYCNQIARGALPPPVPGTDAPEICGGQDAELFRSGTSWRPSSEELRAMVERSDGRESLGEAMVAEVDRRGGYALPEWCEAFAKSLAK